MTPDVEAFWLAFCAATGTSPDARCDVWRFGDSDALADELLALVVDGPKRATTDLVSTFESEGEALPEVGGYSVVCDGRDLPSCVLRTTEVVVQPLCAVDEAFARDEGEGDRTRAGWWEAHRAYFTRALAARGEEFRDDLPAVFERFELVWPTR
jgi:uncharacterized protein YhfF